MDLNHTSILHWSDFGSFEQLFYSLAYVFLFDLLGYMAYLFSIYVFAMALSCFD